MSNAPSTTVKDAVNSAIMQRAISSQSVLGSETTMLPDDTLDMREKVYRQHDVEMPPPTNNGGLVRQPLHFGISPFECEETQRRRKEEEDEKRSQKQQHR